MALTKTEEYNRAGRRVFNYLTKLKLDPDMAFQILLSGIANVMSRFCDDCFEAYLPARPFTTSLPDLVDILIVNAIEAEMLGGGDVSSLETAAYAAERLAARFKSVVVTAGGDGVASFDRSGHAFKLSGIKVAVASTHGAGDTFVGTLAARMALGDPFEVALSTANREAAKLVSTPEEERET